MFILTVTGATVYFGMVMVKGSHTFCAVDISTGEATLTFPATRATSAAATAVVGMSPAAGVAATSLSVTCPVRAESLWVTDFTFTEISYSVPSGTSGRIRIAVSRVIYKERGIEENMMSNFTALHIRVMVIGYNVKSAI